MKKYFVPLLLISIPAFPDGAPFQIMPAKDMPKHHHVPAHGFFGQHYPMRREATGTSWIPQTSPKHGIMFHGAKTAMMAGGIAHGTYSHQDGDRGTTEAFSTNMVMVRGYKDFGDTTFGLRTMFSLEPTTTGSSGYPLLLQTGETGDGITPLIDRQHPHDFFMEFAISLAFNLGDKTSAFLYAALPGEPALGPAFFMARYSGMEIPYAPITHHWFDSTHIAWGVITAGYVYDWFKLDASIFNGRESNEERWDFETPQLDSFAIRATVNPEKRLSLQVSYANINSPEQLAPEVDTQRITVTLAYHLSALGIKWQTMLGFGRNINSPGRTLDGLLAESTINFWGGHTFFGRFEWVEKDELLPEGDPLHGRVFDVAKLGLGYIFEFLTISKLKIGLGGSVLFDILPSDLRDVYGDDPVSYLLFVRIKI